MGWKGIIKLKQVVYKAFSYTHGHFTDENTEA